MAHVTTHVTKLIVNGKNYGTLCNQNEQADVTLEKRKHSIVSTAAKADGDGIINQTQEQMNPPEAKEAYRLPNLK